MGNKFELLKKSLNASKNKALYMAPLENEVSLRINKVKVWGVWICLGWELCDIVQEHAFNMVVTLGCNHDSKLKPNLEHFAFNAET